MRIAEIETRPSRTEIPRAWTLPSATAEGPSAAAPTRTSIAATEPPPAGRRPATDADRSAGPLDAALTPPWAPPGSRAA
jgi:hypothetical protein